MRCENYLSFITFINFVIEMQQQQQIKGIELKEVLMVETSGIFCFGINQRETLLNY